MVAGDQGGQLHPGIDRERNPAATTGDALHPLRGLRNGLERTWSAKGGLLLRRRNYNGRLHGLSERWYENGRIREKGKYLKGRKVGQWVQYGMDGSVLTRHSY